MQGYDPPAARHAERSGRWIAEAQWPSPRVRERVLAPWGDGRLRDRAGPSERLVHMPSPLSGSDAGAWCPYGEITDFPPDQRGEDGVSLCFDTEALQEPLEILGYPEAILELAIDRPLGLAAVRLCDVAPEGPSLLVARGLLNLSHRDSDVDLAPMPVGTPTVVRVRLDMTGHAFAPGHRIRLAVSAGYWPFAWPAPESVRLELRLGGATRLLLPVREAGADASFGDAAIRFEAPEQAAPAPGRVRHKPWRKVHRDLRSGRLEIDVGGSEHSRLDETGLSFGERTERRFTLVDGDPLSARVDCQGRHFLERGDWRIRVQLRTSMSATAESFVIAKDLDAFEGEVCVHSAHHSVEIPRDHV
jgi:hypothetical protein